MFFDETLVRLLPVLRRSWSKKGRQALVPITGRNAKRAIYGALDVRTGKRVVRVYTSMRRVFFEDYLYHLQKIYRGREIIVLLDRAPSHQFLDKVQVEGIHFFWLPKQCSELNCMDQLWKEAKTAVSANRQYNSIDEHAYAFAEWVKTISKKQALTKAGVLAKYFWLKKFLY